MPPATTGKSSLPAIAANALLVLVSVFAGFLIMEFAVRAAAWAGSSTTSGNREWSSTFEYSVTRHHRLKPGTVYRHAELEYDYLWINNSLGMRDRERDTGISAAKSFRILFLGDSMVQGYGVPLEESMVYLLENRLNEVPRRQRIDVLNAGVFGYSPMLEYLCLQELAPIVQPDLVMVGFFVGNDVGDDHFYRQQAILQDDGSLRFDDEDWPWTYMNELLDSRLESEAKQRAMHDPRFAQELAALWQKVVQRLVRHSRLMAYLAKGAGNRDQRAALEHRSRQERQIAEEYRSDIRVNPGLINYPVLDKEARLRYWQVSLDYLSKIRLFTAGLGIPMLIVVIPTLEPEINQFSEPYDILDEFGAREDIPVIQLLPDLRKHPAETLTYPLDGHWNSLGNRVAAESVARQLREPGLARLLPGVDQGSGSALHEKACRKYAAGAIAPAR